MITTEISINDYRFSIIKCHIDINKLFTLFDINICRDKYSHRDKRSLKNICTVFHKYGKFFNISRRK